MVVNWVLLGHCCGILGGYYMVAMVSKMTAWVLLSGCYGFALVPETGVGVSKWLPLYLWCLLGCYSGQRLLTKNKNAFAHWMRLKLSQFKKKTTTKQQLYSALSTFMATLTRPAGAADEKCRSSSKRRHSSRFSVTLSKCSQLYILLIVFRTVEIKKSFIYKLHLVKTSGLFIQITWQSSI